MFVYVVSEKKMCGVFTIYVKFSLFKDAAAASGASGKGVCSVSTSTYAKSTSESSEARGF